MIRGKPGRAVCILLALGAAAVVVAVVLLLRIQRQVIAQHRAREQHTLVEHAKQRCDLLKGVLVARLEELAKEGPQAASLHQIAPQVEAVLDEFRMLKQTGQPLHILVVGPQLEPVAALDPQDAQELSRCARHVLEGEERFYTLPRRDEPEGAMPRWLCYTYPIRRGDTLLGGAVVHKELDPVGDVFAGIRRKMTWTVLITQFVLLAALAAIAYCAHRAVAQAERRRAADERLAAIGNLAAGIAHEVRNPLNTVALTCRYLQRIVSRGDQAAHLRSEVHRNFEIVASELGRLTRTLDDFLLLAKPADLDCVEVDVDDVVDDALALFGREFEAAHVRLVRRRNGPPAVRADPDRLRQVFANIVQNGIQAMPEGGTLSVTTESADGEARVVFADTGPGIRHGDRGRIFEPYFSTKRSGIGLGLSLSLKIVRAHGGAIDVGTGPDGGAVFTVSLPASEAPHA
ncbi:MAG: sensor histidine kinase [Candidatus Brocadiia bacterium]